MKEGRNIEDLQAEPRRNREDVGHPDLSEVMNHPERYSEGELRAFLEHPERVEEGRYVLMARMANKRKRTACPDADKAWEAFKPRLESHVSRKKSLSLRMWGAALAGAVAMLAVVWLYNAYLRPSVPEGEVPEVVAMLRNETPQYVTLQHQEEVIALPQTDSLSFRVSGREAMENGSSSDGDRQEAVRMQKLSTPRGMDFKVILPDGSEVWLNAESTIEFPAAFRGDERRVLLKGEAYFKVARDEACPFLVVSDQMKVRVLGTEFNFKSYASETSHVSLVKGAVEVLRSEADRPDATLKPGQDAWRDEEGKIHVREVDTYVVTQWVNGFFYFDNLPLVEILCELGRWYNLGVVFRNPSSMQYKMHFSASRSADIRQAIENLNRLRKVRVCIEGTDIVVY